MPKYILTLLTRVLQWESKVLDGGKTPKQRFEMLKNENGVITQEQWEQYYSVIAPLRNTEPAANARNTCEQKSAWTASSEKVE